MAIDFNKMKKRVDEEAKYYSNQGNMGRETVYKGKSYKGAGHIDDYQKATLRQQNRESTFNNKMQGKNPLGLLVRSEINNRRSAWGSFGRTLLAQGESHNQDKPYNTYVNNPMLQSRNPMTGEYWNHDSRMQHIGARIGLTDYRADLAQAQKEKAQENAGPVMKNLMEISPILSEIGTDMAANYILPGAGRVAMFGRASGQAMREARQYGANYDQQALYGLGVGSVETMLEGISSTGAILRKAYGKGLTDEVVDEAAKRMAARIAKNSAKTKAGATVAEQVVKRGAGAVGEGTEEALADLINPLLKQAAGINQYDTLGEYYTDPEFLPNMAKDFAMGAEASLILGIPESGINVYRGSKITDEQLEQIVEEAKQSDPTSEAHLLATELEEDIKNGKQITDTQKLELAQATVREIASRPQAEPEDEFSLGQTLGIDLSEGDEELAQSAVQDEILGTKENVKRVLRTFAADNISEEEEAQMDAQAQSVAFILRGIPVGNLSEQMELLAPGNEMARQAFAAMTGIQLSENESETFDQVQNYMRTALADLGDNIENRINSKFNEVYSGGLSNTERAQSYGEHGQRGYAFALNKAVEANRNDTTSDLKTRRARIHDAQAVYSAYYTAGQDSTPQTRDAMLERLHNIYSDSSYTELEREAMFENGENDKNKIREKNRQRVASRKAGNDNTNTWSDDEGPGVTNIASEGSFTAEQVKGFDTLANALGVKIELHDTLAGNGEYQNGVIRISSESEDPFMTTVGHEFTHGLKDKAPEEYQAWADYVASEYNKQRPGEWDALIEERIKRYNDFYAKLKAQGKEAPSAMTRDEAIEEILADSAERFFRSKEDIEALTRTNKTLAERFKAFIEDLINSLKAIIDKSGRGYGDFYDELGILEEARDLYAKAIEKAEFVAKPFAEVAETETDKKYSIDSLAQSVGVTFSKRGNQTVFKDKNGKVVDSFTRDMVSASPLGSVLNDSVERGVISREECDKQFDLYASLMNQLLGTQDIDLIWALNGTIGFNPMPSEYMDEEGNRMPESFDGKSKFAAETSNADPQYGRTIDFTTICLKTQATVDAMSQTMMNLGRGLSKDEIIDVVFKNVYEAGEPVPCPVCYVFSRWVGLGELFDKMKTMQNDYPLDMDMSEIRRKYNELDKQVKEIVKETGKDGSDARALLQRTLKKQYKAFKERFNLLDENDWMSKNLGTEGLTKEEAEELEDLRSKLEILDRWSWLGKVRLHKDYAKKGLVPDDVLFDLNNARTFANKYPVAWKYRSTRGPSLGKVAAPYSPEILGQVLKGAGGNLKTLGTSKNHFLTPTAKGTLNADAKKQLGQSVKTMRWQNLLNGHRMQSTSDFRFEYALDYLLAYTELQALGAKVQLYTKVPESVRMHAKMGAEVNLSLMPYGTGIDKNGNLVYSDVTGMSYEDALMLQKLYDNVQTILVAVSEEHLTKAMADDNIRFIIPYHSSGGTNERYVAMMDIVGEAVEDRTDFGPYETETVVKDATKEQRAARTLRTKLVQGNLANPTEKEVAILQSNEILRQLYIRFYGVNEYGEIEKLDPKFVEPSNLSEDGTRDISTFHAFMPKKQAELIMPYEYWDKLGTNETADENGERYCAYVASLGLHPKFSGWSKAGGYTEKMDFTKKPGYWKTLIDRSMYNNDGTYHEQKPINISEFDASMLFEEQNKDGLKTPSRSNDKSKVSRVAKLSADEIRKKKYSAPKKDDEGRKLTKEQSEFFKDSKVRDEKGNLMRLYHGTVHGGFTVFNPLGRSGTGIWATDVKDLAEEEYSGSEEHYAPTREDGPTEESWVNYDVYMNITNPYIVQGNGRAWDDLANPEFASKQFVYGKLYSQPGDDLWEIEWEESGWGNFETDTFTTEELDEYFGRELSMILRNNPEGFFSRAIDKDGNLTITDTNGWTDYAFDQGYDGVIFYDIWDGGEGTGDVFVAFNSNQVKSINNANPTEDPDIRYSVGASFTEKRIDFLIRDMSDSEGKTEGWVAWISPNDFLKLTLRDKFRDAWAEKRDVAWDDIPEDMRNATEDELIDYVRKTNAENMIEVPRPSKAERYNWAEERGWETYDDVPELEKDLGFVKPSDFKSIGTEQKFKEGTHRIFVPEVRPFNMEDLTTERQTPFLKIDGSGRVTGHEGRHRTFAMMNEGVEKIPVVIKLDDRRYRQPIDSLKLKAQDFGDGPINDDYEGVATNLIPVNRENESNLANEFGQESDIRYSVTPAEDREYMDAVEAGDMAKAQKMVDKVAQKWGAYSNSKSGRPKKVYHGTANSFNTFGISSEDIGIHFGDKTTARDRLARTGRKKNGKLINAYIKLDKPVVLDTDPGGWVPSRILGEDSYILRLLLTGGYIDQEEVSRIAKLKQEKSMRDEMLSILKGKGYDGVKYINEYEGNGTTSYIVFDKNNVKSADPVTYDDDGNVIPLSERFKPENNDIRYSVSKEAYVTESALKEAEKSAYAKGLSQTEESELGALAEEFTKNLGLTQTARLELNRTLLKMYRSRRGDEDIYEQADKAVDIILKDLGYEAPVYSEVEMLPDENGTLALPGKVEDDFASELRETILMTARYADTNNTYADRRNVREAKVGAKLEETRQRAAENETKLRNKIEATKKAEQLKRIEQAKKDRQRLLRTVARIKQAQREKEARQRTARERRKILDKIAKHYERLYKLATNPTDARHLPNGFEKAVADFLVPFNFETDRSKPDSKSAQARAKRYFDVADLADELEKASEKSDSILTIDPAQVAIAKRVGKVIQNKRLADLTLDELEDVYKLMRVLETVISHANKSFTDGITASINERAQQAIEETRDRGKVYKKGKAGDMLNQYLTSNTKPRDFFRILTREEGALHEAYMGIRKAFNRHINNMTDFRNVWDKTIDYKKVREWRKQSTKFKLESGQEIRLTVPQVMALYELNKRGQARGHIYGAGVIATDEELSRKAKREDKGNKKTGREAFINKRVNVTAKDVMDICKSLTEEQRTVANKLQKIMSTMGSEWGNQASLRMYNYKKFTEQDYFPISVLNTWLDEKSGVPQAQRIRTLGMTKQVTPNADNPLVLDDIFSVTIDHMNKMSMYTMTPELTDFERIWNYKNKDENVSLREEFEATYGKNASQYVKNLMDNVNGFFARDENIGIFDQTLSMFKRAHVGASIRVLIQQPTAILRAGAYLNPAYLIKGIATPGYRKARDEMFAHSPIARWKSWGFYETDTAKSMESIIENKRELADFTMGAYGVADNAAWTAMWNAVKTEVEHKHKHLTKGSPEYWRTVTDRFEELVDHTQVVDSVLHRSQLMRSKNVLIKSSTAFMSEPTTTVNMLQTECMLALQDIQSGDKGKAAKRVSRVVSTIIVTGLATSMASALVDAMRHSWAGGDDDDKSLLQLGLEKSNVDALIKLSNSISKWKHVEPDENMNFLERWIAHTKKNIPGNVNPLQMMPFVKDLFTIMEGYSVERADISMVEDLWDSIDKFKEFLGGDSSYSLFYILNNMVGSIAEFGGVPYKNAFKDVQGVARTVAEAMGHGDYANYLYNSTMYNQVAWNQETEAASYMRAVRNNNASDAEKIKGSLTNKYGMSEEDFNKLIRKQITNGFKDAIKNGDAQAMKSIKEDLKRVGYSNEEIQKEVTAKYRNVLKDALDASDYDQVKKIATRAKADGISSKDLSAYASRRYGSEYREAYINHDTQKLREIETACRALGLSSSEFKQTKQIVDKELGKIEAWKIYKSQGKSVAMAYCNRVATSLGYQNGSTMWSRGVNGGDNPEETMEALRKEYGR